MEVVFLRIRNRVALCLMTGIIALQSGCFFKSTNELYAVPQASKEYQNLKATIDAVKGTADYAPPTSGRNTQTVQLVDLDGDGVQEAVSFFRDTSAEKPLKIYIFRQNDNGTYEVDALIEGEGTSIESISYRNLGSTKAKEIIVSWRMSTSVRTLVAYSLVRGTVTELMRTGYSYYTAVDMDEDGNDELLLLQVDTSGSGESNVEYYDFRDGVMALGASAPLSKGVTSVRSYRSGKLKDYIPAYFVTSNYGENGVITDVFTVKDGTLRNITLDETTGRSTSTFRLYSGADPTDINQDGILELPKPQVVRSYNKSATADDFWVIKWQQYDENGEGWPVYTTYHNFNTYDRWYLILPDEWEGLFTISRNDFSTSVGERAVYFSYWTGHDEAPPEPFLVIYKLTGSNRSARSKLGNRFILTTESDAIYAAEFLPCSWDCGLDEQELISRFRLIKTDWSTYD